MTHTNIVKFIKSLKGNTVGSADGIKALFDRLDNPQRSLSVIKVLGESGKSSVISMLSSALSGAGYTVGTLTTPFIHTVESSFKISGESVSIDVFSKYADTVISEVIALQKEYGYEFSRCDVLLAISACILKGESCNIGIIEVENGALASSLFTVSPLNVITSTSDQKIAKLLCPLIEKTAGEVVSAIQSKEVYKLISDRCAEVGTRLTIPLKNAFLFMRVSTKRLYFTYEGKVYTLKTGAYYQAQNFLCAIKAIEALRRAGFKIDNVQIGASEINEGLPLRFEVISVLPTIIVDRADTAERRRHLTESIGKLDGIRGDVSVICESGLKEIYDEFSILGLDPKGTEIPLKGSRNALKSFYRTVNEDSFIIIIGTSEYCEEISKHTKELFI